MFSRLLSALCLCCCCVAPQLAAEEGTVEDATPSAEAGADADTWRLERDADGIAVWTRAVEGSRHRAIRARMVVSTPMAELVAIIRDTAACREWAQFCAESYVHESLSPHEAYIYTLNDMPWPVTDRDALSHVLWHVDEAAGVVTMEAVATDGIMEPNRGRVRLTEAYSTWVLRQTEDGLTEVSTEAHVDPAGPVPAWITNRLLVDAPFKTMQQLRELGETGRYTGADLDFLTAEAP